MISNNQRHGLKADSPKALNLYCLPAQVGPVKPGLQVQGQDPPEAVGVPPLPHTTPWQGTDSKIVLENIILS